MAKKDEMEAGTEERRGAPAFCGIEEHAKALGVSAPVFAAVTQAQNWAAGKKVARSEFENAVKAFLNAPIGGGK